MRAPEQTREALLGSGRQQPVHVIVHEAVAVHLNLLVGRYQGKALQVLVFVKAVLEQARPVHSARHHEVNHSGQHKARQARHKRRLWKGSAWRDSFFSHKPGLSYDTLVRQF